MPIQRESWDRWLNGTIEEATALIQVPASEVFSHGAADPGQQIELTGSHAAAPDARNPDAGQCVTQSYNHTCTMRLLVACLALLMFTACGGGDDSPVPRIGASTISMSAPAVWHAWSSVYDPNNPNNCPDLYAVATFTATPGPFPADIKVLAIDVYGPDGSLIWSGPARNDTRVGLDGSLRVAAAACGLIGGVQIGQPHTVRFVLQGQGAVIDFVTPPLTLEFVS